MLPFVLPMSKISIYIPAMKLNRIKVYSKDKGISVSRIFVRGVMSLINSQPMSTCNLCRNIAVGKFKILVHDWEQGEQKVEKYLCEFHLKKAKSEGEVKEL